MRRSIITQRRWLLFLRLGAAVVPLLFLGLFYLYPLIAIVSLSLSGETFSTLLVRLPLSALGHLLAFTFGQAFLSTLLTLALGLPGAFIIARYDFPGKSLFLALTTLPFVLPTVVVAAAFNLILGRFDLRYTLTAILVAHVFYNVALVMRMVGSFWAHLDPALEEAAQMLGASPWRAFREVTLPLLTPAVGASSLLVFIFSFTSFGVVLILGGPRFATLEVEIYRQATVFADFPLAALLSLLQIGITLGAMVLYARLQRRMSRPLMLRSRRVILRPLHGRRQGWAWLYLGGLLFFLTLPPLMPVLRSLRDGGLAYRMLFRNPRRSIFYVPPVVAVRNSLLLALATMGLALTLGLLTAWLLHRRQGRWWLDALFMLPLGTSAVTLGFGYLIAWGRPCCDLRGTAGLIVVAHTLVALPLVVRAILPSLQAIPPSLREAAAVLGAPPLRRFLEIDLPLIWRSLAVGALFAFTVSMGEFGATSLLARPERPTLPVAIYRFLARPGTGNYDQAMAMASILVIVSLAAFLLIEHLRPPGEGTLF